MYSERQVHIWNHCNACGASPIIGKRHECQTCSAGPEIDFCSDCFKKYQIGKIKHPLSEDFQSACEKHEFKSFSGQNENMHSKWLSVPLPDISEPIVNDAFLVRPEFCTRLNSSFGGYGFTVKTSIGQVMLTALHVLDDLLKTYNINTSFDNKKYTGCELSEIISKVYLYNVLKEKWMLFDLGSCSELVVLPEAGLGELEPISHRDICAFKVDNTSLLSPAELASKCPEIGEPVWLAARHSDSQRTRMAVVVEKTSHSLIYKYAENTDLPRYCSGAPIIDHQGNVVGINVGSGFVDGERLGHANHVDNIKRHLNGARIVNLASHKVAAGNYQY